MEIHIYCIYVLHPPNSHSPPIPSHFSIQNICKVESRIQSPESRVQSPVQLLDSAIKAPANEETLLRKHCCGNIVSSPRKRGNICRKNKMFLKKVRNIFVSRKQKMFPQQMFSVLANGETFRETTMFPQQCSLVCGGLK